HAYDFRSTMRPVWLRSGALTWLQGLDLPKPKPRTSAKAKPPKRKAVSALGASGAAKSAPPAASVLTEKPLSDAQEKRLRKWFPDLPRLRGYVTAIAWSPGMVMPTVWLLPLMEMLQAAQGKKAKAPTMETMNTVLQDLMQLYNHLNGMVLTHDPNRLPDVLPSPGAAYAWAAGFVQAAEVCAAEWRGAGFAVKSNQMPFKALFALAAQATARPDGWRATDVEGQAVLTGVPADPPPPEEVLTHSLTPLWWVIAPLRQQRVKG
ncbi:MAG: UPF0149 family protein, partial [Burkholderiaceae bacterium]